MRLRKLSVILNTFVFLCLTNVLAQNGTSGKIIGLVLDQSTNRPLEFVNVVLLKTADSTVTTGTVTDKNGKFELIDVPPNEYSLRFSLIGYKEKKTIAFVIDAQHSKLSIGTTKLVETTVNLDEVLITSQKALFNNAIDRKVYNIDQDIMSKSGSASELLQNIPSIEVDIDGNVSLRGSSSILILINGKNSPLMGKSRATVLQQMPANSIEKIEVITNPSAKYKPEGTSGIINIVLKKNTGLGTNGNITGNVGNNSRYNGNIRLNYNPGDYNVFASYSIRSDSRNRFNTDTRNLLDLSSVSRYYREDLSSYSSPLSHMVTAGIDYEIDDLNSFGVSGNYFYNGFTRNDSSKKVYKDVSGIAVNRYDRDRHDIEFEKEYGFKFSYEHKFENEDHKLSLEINGSNAPEQEDNHFTNFSWVPSAPTTYDNTLIKQGEGQYQVTLDYSNPLSKETKLEAGYAGEFNNRDQDFYAEYLDPGT
jgi:hypothetical protein